MSGPAHKTQVDPEAKANRISALTVVRKCSSLKQPEDKHLASQHKPQERPINGSPYGEHPVEEEAWPEP